MENSPRRLFPRLRLPRSRGELVCALLVAGLFAGMAISLPLWLSDRPFPMLPAPGMIVSLPGIFAVLALAVTALFLLASAVQPDHAPARWLALLGCLFLAWHDQMRWQPWYYEYVLMLLLAALAGGPNRSGFLPACRVVLLGLYAWSGLHKLTAAYPRMYETTFTAPLTGQWPDWAVSMVRHGGTLSPWLEIAIAAALCWRRTRSAGVIAAVGTHVFILLLTGPAGTDVNAVIWPWNAVSAALVLLLFWKVENLGWKDLSAPRPALAAGVAALLAMVMPAFSIRGKWDRYLSFQLYSGSDRRLVILLENEAAFESLPSEWKPHVLAVADGSRRGDLHPHTLALALLRVPTPGDERHVLALARALTGMEFARRGQVKFYTDFTFRPDLGWDIFTPQEIQTMPTIPPLRQRFQ